MNACLRRCKGGALAALALCIALPGCLSRTEPVVEAPPLDRAEKLLMEAALRAETALIRLARLEGAPDEGGDLPRVVPAGLLERVDVSFVGPVETLVEEMARKVGFGFDSSGTAPARPVVVEVRARSRPVIMVLRDAGVQAGREAALVVDAERRHVRLDWTGGGR